MGQAVQSELICKNMQVSNYEKTTGSSSKTFNSSLTQTLLSESIWIHGQTRRICNELCRTRNWKMPLSNLGAQNHIGTSVPFFYCERMVHKCFVHTCQYEACVEIPLIFFILHRSTKKNRELSYKVSR